MVDTRQFRRRRSGGWWAAALVTSGTALLLAAGPAAHLAFAGGAASVSQSFGAANASAGTTLAATTGTATGTGDLLVATIRDRDTTALATVAGVTDSANDTWVEATRVSQGSQADEEIWYLADAPSVTSVTVTVSGSSALAFTVIDVTGASSSALDVTATNGGSGTTASTGTTATTAVADEIAVADIGWNAKVTPGAQTAGYTTQSGVEQSTASGEAAGEQAAWQVLSSTGAQSYGATLSSAVAWTGAIATFMAAASPPVITGFNPSNGVVGTTVTITGSGFTGTSAVKFNGTTATYSVTDDQHISTSVPTGASTGTVTVTTPDGTATSTTPFTVNSPPVPMITNLSPTSGVIGTPVTISGSGFTDASAVKFNGATAAYSVTDDQHISTSVPTGASTGTITVTTPGGTATSSTFTVNPSPMPTITTFNPLTGPVTTPVTITGTGFTGASVVTFNGTGATFSVTDDSHISTSVPSGATTGLISVTAPGGTAMSSTSFTVTSPPSKPHIMVIVEENQEYGNVIGSSNAPYINSLGSTYTSATNWYAVEHNSPTDYLDLISGSDQGLGGTTKKTPPFSATNLVDELHSANIPWQAYMESMPSGCSMKGSNGLYDPIHNPFHYFTNYGSYCTSGSGEGVVPYPGSAGLVTALDGSNAPDFVFVSPNNCDDMHGSTSGSTTCASDSRSQLIAAGDTWLKDNLGPVLNSTWFQNNGVVILTWDEGTTKLGLAGGSPPDDGSCTSPNVPECGGHIPTLVIASKAAGSFTSGGDLYGALRGIEEAYGVGLLGHSSGTNDGDLEPAFGLGSSTTGGVAGQVTDQSDPSHPAVSGAQVTCSCGGTLTTTTDGSGNYSFTNVTAGSGYSLSFSDTGYTTETISSFSVTAGSTTAENEALPETGGVVSGTVTDATAMGNPPINGATVTCNCTNTPTTTTDSLGDYKFTQVTPGTAYTVSVSATGYTTGGSGSFAVTGGQATTGIDASLAEAGGVVSGTVTNANTSAEISGATVICNCAGTPTTITDGSGDYQITQVTPGSGYTVSVSAPNYLSGSSGTFTVTGGTTTTGIDVSLTPSPATLGVAQSFGAANVTSGTTLSALTGTATGSGDLLVATIRDRNTTAPATVTAVTDSSGNKWVRAAGFGKGQADGEIWYAAGATSVSSVTVTVTSASAIAFTVLDVSGASSSPLDVTATAAGSGTTASTGATGTTSQTTEIAVADIGWNATVTPSAQTPGYTTQSGVEQSTVGGDYAGEQAAWQVLSSTGAESYGAALSSSVAWTGVIATFEAA